MTYYSILKSPLGNVTLVANETELIGLYFVNHRHMPEARDGWTLNKKHPVLQKAEKELTEYFAGKRDSFFGAGEPWRNCFPETSLEGNRRHPLWQNHFLQ